MRMPDYARVPGLGQNDISRDNYSVEMSGGHFGLDTKIHDA